jgi:hypothetical protein
MKHPLCALALLSLLAACAPLPTQPDDAATTASATPPTPHLRVLGSVGLDYATPFGDTLVGGLSGIDYDPATQRYLLISDDRATHDPVRAYTAKLRYSSSGLQPPEFTAVTFLLHPGQQRFTPAHRPQPGVEVPDPEAARWLPGTEAFLWTSEGDFARGFGPQLRTHHWGDGAQLRHYQLPDAFTPRPAEGMGPRANGTLEGLALSPDGRTAWLAMELPWWQDGPLATHERPGGPVRITAIDVESGQALRQIAYQPDALPHAPRLPLVAPVLGVSEILADGEHHLLVLERAYSLGHGFHVRLYRIDTRQGSDTLGLAALQPGNHRVPPKTLVADFAQLALPSVDNIEGMTWGPELPELPGGGCVLVFVSDNNFNPAQRTQFIAAHYQGMGDGEGHCSAPRSQP